MLWDTLWLYGLIGVCGVYAKTAGYWRIALPITSFCVILPWAMFLVIRYLKVDGWIKAGICTMFAGIFMAVINDVIELFISGQWSLTIHNADFLQWGRWGLFWNNANIYMLILIIALVCGMVLIGLGVIRMIHKKRKQS